MPGTQAWGVKDQISILYKKGIAIVKYIMC